MHIFNITQLETVRVETIRPWRAAARPVKDLVRAPCGRPTRDGPLALNCSETPQGQLG